MPSRDDGRPLDAGSVLVGLAVGFLGGAVASWFSTPWIPAVFGFACGFLGLYALHRAARGGGA